MTTFWAYPECTPILIDKLKSYDVALASELMVQFLTSTEVQNIKRGSTKFLSHDIRRTLMGLFRVASRIQRKQLVSILPKLHDNIGLTWISALYSNKEIIADIQNDLSFMVSQNQLSYTLLEAIRKQRVHKERILGGTVWEDVYSKI